MIGPVRWLRLRGFARGALRRPSDRAERGLFLVTVAAACFAVPVGGMAVEALPPDTPPPNAYVVSAVLTQDAFTQNYYSEYGTFGRSSVTATWRAPNGEPRSGQIDVEPAARAGSTVPLWTDGTGTVIGAPRPQDELEARAIVVGLAGAAGWLLAVAAVSLLAGRLLRRHRINGWGEEWRRVERQWHNPAGSSD